MFGITNDAEEGRSIRLATALPLEFHLIDLGHGLRDGLTTCNTVTPDEIVSIPMKALWKGFTHPGITWAGTVTFDQKNIMTLFAASAVSEFGEQPGGTSYAILSGDYLNLSMKFGYHFSTIDTLCGDNSNQNYISLQFSGGAGSYYGKSMRVSFLGNVLARLGFQVSLQGDLIEAFVSGHDCQSQQAMLDLTGRLLASSRLLDMTLSSQSDVERLSDAFFREEYDYLTSRRDDELTSFYTHGGFWKRSVEDGHVFGVQDGSRSGFTISSGVAGVMGKLMGQALQDFLDNIEAYYSFPLAIVKNSELSDGRVAVRVQPVRGHIDRAGGIAFGVRNIGNYFVLRINALENNVILFEYVNSKRMKRAIKERTILSNTWYTLLVEIRGRQIAGYINGELILEYVADKTVAGFIGLWTKADSVTFFDELTIETSDRQRSIPF
jgi:pyruvate,water dikinase